MQSGNDCPGRNNCQAIKDAITDDNWLQYWIRVFRKRGKADNRFDFNLIEGEMKEKSLRELLNGRSVEVKRDFFVSKSGNVAVELKEGLKPTGLSVTQAEWQGIVLDGDEYDGEVVVLIKTDRLKRIVKSTGVSKRGGDKGQTLVRLVKVSDLFLRVNDEEQRKAA
jgi:hypothetical protein